MKQLFFCLILKIALLEEFEEPSTVYEARGEISDTGCVKLEDNVVIRAYYYYISARSG